MKIIVIGASITASPWFTWKDFLEIESGIVATDLSRKGAGNEYMVTALAQHADQLDADTLVLIMMTNVDKFDWYVEDARYKSLLGEKHPPNPISKSSGFWCTGHWFPLEKELYQKNFYSLDYFTTKTIQQIMLAKSICQQRGAKLELLFDSPIWNYTEQDLYACTQGKDPSSCCQQLLELPLSNIWSSNLSSTELNLEHNSLIGHCWQQNLPWENDKFSIHPPSGSHWSFYDKILRPRISNQLTLRNDSDLQHKIQKLDQVWNKK